MKKIPSLFVRDHNTGLVVPELNPRAEWVMQASYPAVQKFDGTCVALFLSIKGAFINRSIGSGEVKKPEDIQPAWMSRRCVTDSMRAPEGFIKEEFDPNTAKTFGWEPITQSPYNKYFQEALENLDKKQRYIGTYELCGPKINGNPEGYNKHKLVFHYDAPQLANIQVLDIHEMSTEEAFEALRSTLEYMPVEGVVWHSMEHGMAKLKKKDFGLEL